MEAEEQGGDDSGTLARAIDPGRADQAARPADQQADHPDRQRSLCSSASEPSWSTRRIRPSLTYNGYVDQINLLRSDRSDPKIQKTGRRPRCRTSARSISRPSWISVRSSTRRRRLMPRSRRTTAIKAALATLGQKSKIKLKLGPSPQFLSNVKLLERIEKSVITDSVDLHKEGGVFWVERDLQRQGDQADGLRHRGEPRPRSPPPSRRRSA